jgi:anti-sigma B factor antagonist
MSEAFTILHEPAGDGRAVVVLSGRLDANHAGEVKDLLKLAIGAGTARLIVDMTGVPFVDSAGLSSLVFGLKLARRAGGDIMLAGVQPQTLTVFSLTMLDKVFAIYPTQQAALENLPT